ncbi:MAG: RCC1 repeat-containing protein, partial [bacterium]
GIADAAGSISMGTSHSCAVVSDGIKCWGNNSKGQLGDTTTTQQDTPVYVNGQEPALAVAVGGLHTCGLLTTGQVKCWGDNFYGQLGDGATARSLVPVGVTDITGVDAGTSASGIAVGQNHSCAVMYDTGLAKNLVKCWGSNFDGQLGDGTTTQPLTPVIVKEYDDTTYTATHTLVDVVAVSAGINFTCALIDDGMVRCWGSGSAGRLGNGASIPRPAAVTVSGIVGADAATTATAIAAGGDHACALMQNGAIKCWGAGGYGQIGDLANSSNTTPATVYGIGNAALANNAAIAVGAGGLHTCAVLAKGNMRCWGNNGYYQLGDGTNTDSNRPLGVDQLDYP